MRRLILAGVTGLCCWHATSFGAIGEAKKTLDALILHDQVVTEMPSVSEVHLKNGMRCFFIEDHLLPLVRFGLIFPAGEVYDPPEKFGLSAMLAAMLRSGGTRQHDAEWIDDTLDANAIKIEIRIEQELGIAGAQALTDDLDTALALFFELLYAPAYQDDRFAIMKGKMAEGVRRRNDQPAHMAQRIFQKVLYGEESPWAATPNLDSIDRITVEDLRALHATLFAPEQMLCAVAGDVAPASLVKRLEALMAQYPERPATQRVPPAVPVTGRPGLWVVPKEVPQSVITVGHVGPVRDDPDRYALVVMNEILGSPATFTSWLTRTIRTEQGLAYEAWSTLKFGPSTAPGMFYAHSKTRAETTAKTVVLLHDNIRKIHAGIDVRADEVDAMRSAILRRFIFQYADPYHLVSSIIRSIALGYPANYLDLYRAGIAAVTREDVRRAARTALHPDALTTVVVGDPAHVIAPLKALGPVNIYPLAGEK
ncbi:MAG: insulinase family protein [Deltaproteobacteria bacterium]|nr:insulinase family protein [Deltaproteobacteria bacterium]